MNPTANPARFLSCYDILRALEVPVDRNVRLPLVVQCPLCSQGRLNVQRDDLLHTEWLHCDACKFAGDLIELCCKRWGLSPDLALRKLKRLGLAVPDKV